MLACSAAAAGGCFLGVKHTQASPANTPIPFAWKIHAIGDGALCGCGYLAGGFALAVPALAAMMAHECIRIILLERHDRLQTILQQVIWICAGVVLCALVISPFAILILPVALVMSSVVLAHASGQLLLQTTPRPLVLILHWGGGCSLGILLHLGVDTLLFQM